MKALSSFHWGKWLSSRIKNEVMKVLPLPVGDLKTMGSCLSGLFHKLTKISFSFSTASSWNFKMLIVFILN